MLLHQFMQLRTLGEFVGFHVTSVFLTKVNQHMCQGVFDMYETKNARNTTGLLSPSLNS